MVRAVEGTKLVINANNDFVRHGGCNINKEVADEIVISSAMPVHDIIRHLGKHGCPDITHRLDDSSCSAHPHSIGGFGDVYRGKLYDATRVAIKTLRLQVGTSDDVCKSLKYAAHELYIWSKCRHPNVLPLVGLVVFRGQIGMVSEWMERGNLRLYLEHNPDQDRFRMSADISAGLAYLHECGIVHGDLKAANILIDDTGAPVLTDFGNAVLQDCTLNFTATTRKTQWSSRWAAPELLDQREGTYSKPADVYALGMTILETFTGQVPYPDKIEPRVMMLVIVQKEPPERPETHIPPGTRRGDALWSLLLRCWANEPGERPGAAEVAKIIHGLNPALEDVSIRALAPTNQSTSPSQNATPSSDMTGQMTTTPNHPRPVMPFQPGRKRLARPNASPQPPPFKKLKREGPPPTSSPYLNAGRVRLPIAPKPGEDDDMWMSRWQALEDPKCIWALGPVLAQLTVGRTGLFHSPWNAQPNPAALSGSALHNISSCVLEVLVAGRKYVDESALRAWAGVIGASSEWTEVVVEIVAATRGPLPIPVSAPSPEDLSRIGSDALRGCALLCLGVPGSELVLAKRLEERRWGEVIVGVAEGWYRAGEVFVSLAAANISGAAGAAARLGVSMVAPGPSNSGRI